MICAVWITMAFKANAGVFFIGHIRFTDERPVKSGSKISLQIGFSSKHIHEAPTVGQRCERCERCGTDEIITKYRNGGAEFRSILSCNSRSSETLGVISSLPHLRISRHTKTACPGGRGFGGMAASASVSWSTALAKMLWTIPPGSRRNVRTKLAKMTKSPRCGGVYA